MRVLLVCAAGMSTSLLVNAMLKNAQPGDTVEAFPITELLHNIDRFDVVLLGPQIKFKLKDVEAIAQPKGIPVAVVEPRVYGMMNGEAAMNQARQLLG